MGQGRDACECKMCWAAVIAMLAIYTGSMPDIHASLESALDF